MQGATVRSAHTSEFLEGAQTAADKARKVHGIVEAPKAVSNEARLVRHPTDPTVLACKKSADTRAKKADAGRTDDDRTHQRAVAPA